MGNGNSWQKRQRSYNKKGFKAVSKPKVLKYEAPFPLEKVYIAPFSKQLVESDSGKNYAPISKNEQPSGFPVFDDYVVLLSNGSKQFDKLCEQYGIARNDLSSLVFMFTGLPSDEFRRRYMVRMADELLRYTDLDYAEVARRCGMGTKMNLYWTMKREYGISFDERRKALRKEGDLDKFQL